MLVYLFRVKYPELKWRPKNASDLLNAKLTRIWQATDEDVRILGEFEKGAQRWLDFREETRRS